MAVFNTDPVYASTVVVGMASLAAVTACTTRAPTPTASLAAANIIICVPVGASQTPVNTTQTRIDSIQVQACSTSLTAATAAQTVLIWQWDGTTAWVVDEILVTLVTPSTSAAAFSTSKSYSNFLLPITHALYVSTTITTTAATTALSVIARGGDYNVPA